jgi:hypothetical protein
LSAQLGNKKSTVKNTIAARLPWGAKVDWEIHYWYTKWPQLLETYRTNILKSKFGNTVDNANKKISKEILWHFMN